MTKACTGTARRGGAALLVLLALTGAGVAGEVSPGESRPGESQPEESRPGKSWPEAKCRLYSAAWGRAIDARGTEGLGEDFLLAHQAFLDSGCVGAREVCPRSPQEIALADLLSIVAINEGMTGSFLPFACPR